MDEAEMGHMAVYENFCLGRPEFEQFPYDYLFKDRLKRLRKLVSDKEDRSETDLAALLHDRLIFPKAMEDTKGRPMWQGSAPQKQLQKDIEDGLLEGESRLKPRELFELKETCNSQCDLDFFRNRTCQGVKAKKRQVWVEHKAAKRAEKLKKCK